MPTEMTTRDHFAAAALTGLLARPDVDADPLEHHFCCEDAYRWADAMLSERCRAASDCPGQDNATNLDAAPAAIADLPDERPPNAVSANGGTPCAASRDGSGTGNTPATHATRGEGSEQSECTEPVAWAVACDYGDYAVALFSDEASAQTEADRRTLVGLRPGCVVVPLYRHPPCQDFSQKTLTLTDAEREAVERGYCALLGVEDMSAECSRWDAEAADTLRGLLERLK